MSESLDCLTELVSGAGLFLREGHGRRGIFLSNRGGEAENRGKTLDCGGKRGGFEEWGYAVMRKYLPFLTISERQIYEKEFQSFKTA